MSRRPDLRILAVFAAVVVIGGLNGVAVRYSNQELTPFWGAALRLFAAAALLLPLGLLRRAGLPRGPALVGVVIYGVLGFAASYALLYWGLVDAPAAAAAVTVALVPLITLVLAPLHGLERFRWQGIAGALVSVVGVAIVFQDQLNANVGVVSLVALFLGAAAVAESTILLKRFPRGDPAMTNALGMVIGATLLLALSVGVGERQAIPQQAATVIALGYLVVFGSVILFMGFLYVLTRWSASATTYQLLFMPLVTVPAAAILKGEPVTAAFVLGGAFVLAGVYLGAVAPPIRLPARGVAPQPIQIVQPAAAEGPGAAPFVPPNCP